MSNRILYDILTQMGKNSSRVEAVKKNRYSQFMQNAEFYIFEKPDTAFQRN